MPSVKYIIRLLVTIKGRLSFAVTSCTYACLTPNYTNFYTVHQYIERVHVTYRKAFLPRR